MAKNLSTGYNVIPMNKNKSDERKKKKKETRGEEQMGRIPEGTSTREQISSDERNGEKKPVPFRVVVRWFDEFRGLVPGE